MDISPSTQTDISICCPSTIGEASQEGMTFCRVRSFTGVDVCQSKNYLYKCIIHKNYYLYKY